MSSPLRGALAAVLTLAIGGALNAIAVRRHWVPRFYWFAAAITPLAIGVLVFWFAN